MGFNELCLPNEMETDVSTEFFNSESTNFENSIDPDERFIMSHLTWVYTD